MQKSISALLRWLKIGKLELPKQPERIRCIELDLKHWTASDDRTGNERNST